MSIMNILERTDRYAEEVGRLKAKIEAKDELIQSLYARIQSLEEMVREMGGNPGDPSINRDVLTYEELEEGARKIIWNRRLCRTDAEERMWPQEREE